MSRVANRTRLDDLVLALMEHEDEAPGRWAYIDELAATLGWSVGFTRTEALYLEHCYLAVEVSPLSQAYVRVRSFDRYEAHERVVCRCGDCKGAGEGERG